jgi:hypothetical protein
MYMLDGIYQSAIAFFFVYMVFAPGTFVTESGLDIAELKRMGIIVATIAVCAANFYVLFNTYRWDWLICLVVVISTLFIWFWTGLYTTFTGSAQFYKGGAEVYGALVFWAVLLLAVVACLLPRFAVKSLQKIYFPLDVDIIREQIKQGKFDYLNQTDAYIPPPPDKAISKVPSDVSKYRVANAQGTMTSAPSTHLLLPLPQPRTTLGVKMAAAVPTTHSASPSRAYHNTVCLWTDRGHRMIVHECRWIEFDQASKPATTSHLLRC